MEIVKECAGALSSESGVIVLTIRKGSTPKGFPRGELLNEMYRNGYVERTLRFDATSVLNWMVKRGVVTITRGHENRVVFTVPMIENGN